ncbi:MAG: NIPSNAP family protein [Alphaproteobacteria bacterium]|nr:NIPSNAP family protein [Alphaproteobacteria bacterium]
MTDTIFEFRDYTLQPGQRETLISLFEREFIEPQEALGAHVRAMFRDRDRLDHFVWIRSFANEQSRFAALDGFYSGPVWKAHRDTANATIIDSDNVMQLRQVSGALDAGTGTPQGLFVSTAYFLAPDAESDFIAAFQRDIMPTLGQAAPFASFITDHAPNAYPPLPVRENETVFLTLARTEARSHERVAEELGGMLLATPEVRRLQPTARSPLR